MYLDFTFYQTDFGGTVSEEKFKSLNIEASGILNYYTFGRTSNLTEVPKYIKYALCELVSLLNEEAEQDSTISSEKVGSYSVTYAGKSNVGASYATKQKRIVHKWLPVELLYRGL